MAQKQNDEELKQMARETTISNNSEIILPVIDIRMKDRAIASSINAIAFAEFGGDLIYANRSTLEMWGYKKDQEMLGRPAVEFWKDKDKAIDMLKALKRTGSWVGELVAKRKDGSFFDAQVSATSISDETGKPSFMMSSFFDMTERNKIEKELRKSEEKYRLLVETMNDGLAIQDGNGILNFVNDKLCEMLGYPKEELIGHSALEFLDEVNQNKLEEQIRLRREGKQAPYEIEFRKKNGQNVPTLVSPQFLFDEDGNFKGSFGIITDITERKRSEEALQKAHDGLEQRVEKRTSELRESEEKFRLIAETNNDIIYQFDLQGLTTYCSPSIEQVLGFTPQEIIGTNIRDYFPSTELEKATENLKRIRSGERIELLELQVLNKNRIPISLEISASPIIKEGNLIGGQGIARNITERKKTEDALRSRELELENKTKNLEEVNTALKVLLKKRGQDKIEIEEKVLSNVKELVEPYLEKLKNSESNEKQKTYVDILESNLQEIISPFIRRLSSKYLSLTPTEIQVADLVRKGKRNKEMADLLHLSPRTIKFHRENIRKKLGITNTKSNLRSHLISLQ